ncbi:UDP-N-acetylmuramoyl-tripeptide--D-alanyl-D-alanine ligase, partial [Candidatus Woesearchaeota archaeon]|nr:UDP-N-acetylmuramoyl-tripeptide--D-alanyl-D-alanine ligase [Candidatus Woesearchaeota archaeon]
MEPQEHRLQALEGPNGSIILDDTYNSSPAAVEAAIDTLLSIPARRRVVV